MSFLAPGLQINNRFSYFFLVIYPLAGTLPVLGLIGVKPSSIKENGLNSSPVDLMKCSLM